MTSPERAVRSDAFGRVAPRRTTAAIVACAVAVALTACASSGTEAASTRPTPPATADVSADLRETIPAGFAERFADVDGVRLRYLVGGEGPPVVLLHGFAQTGHMWFPLMKELSARHTVVVPDLRGAGGSSKPDAGYDKKTMAQDVHALTSQLGHRHVAVVGHDIGLMVAYAFAAQHPDETDRVVLMDAFLPGVGDWKSVWLMRDLWHFHFYGETPLALVHGRERIYLEHFWNDFAADRNHSVSEADRRFYAAQFAQPGAVHAGFEWFRAFERDANDFAELARRPLSMPVLVLTGEKASGPTLIEQTKLVATNVRGVIVPGVGHWLMDEAPQTVVPEIVTFID
jgi:pimeloyl-ACP methyl ester carboxylesterase